MIFTCIIIVIFTGTMYIFCIIISEFGEWIGIGRWRWWRFYTTSNYTCKFFTRHKNECKHKDEEYNDCSTFIYL